MTAQPVNATTIKFGCPATLIREYRHWMVLLRPNQLTLGSLVLVTKGEVRSLPELSVEAYQELKAVTSDIEAVLAAAFAYDRINYLVFMMVDPHVHFHVVPRYSAAREFAGVTFQDPGWPKYPQMLHVHEMPPPAFAKLGDELRRRWPTSTVH